MTRTFQTVGSTRTNRVRAWTASALHDVAFDGATLLWGMVAFIVLTTRVA